MDSFEIQRQFGFARRMNSFRRAKAAQLPGFASGRLLVAMGTVEFGID